jgi:hypothetical protein
LSFDGFTGKKLRRYVQFFFTCTGKNSVASYKACFVFPFPIPGILRYCTTVLTDLFKQ